MAGFVSLVAALIGSLAAATAPATALEPIGKWVVSGEEGLCLVSRTFGAGADQVQFGVRPLGSEQKVELLLVGPRNGGGQQAGRGRVAFDRGEAIPGMYGSYVFDRPAQRITTLTIDRDIRPAMAAASTMAIEAGAVTVTVRLVSVGAALNALAQCEDLMLRRWGVDTAAYHAERSHSTALDPEHWFGPDQYPEEALRANVQGRTVALLAIAADGRVSDCRVVMTAGHPALDKRTCGIARQRARFVPARGADGMPAASSFVLPVRWLLPSG